MHRYIIEGNTIQREEVSSTQIGLVSELLPRLTSYMPVELSPLPYGTRYIANEPRGDNGQRIWLLVERPPTLTRILFKAGPASSDRESRSYRIHIPWQYFWFVLDASTMTMRDGEQTIWTPRTWGLFWAKTAFTNLEDEVTYSRMPNCWTNGTICVGTTSVNANQSIGQFVDAAINTFYTSEFNKDLDYPWPYRNMTDWEKAAEADPQSWETWDCWDSVHSLHDMLRFAVGEEERFRDPVPATVGDRIQDLPIFQTWANLEEWTSELDPATHARLREVLNG